KIKSGITSKSLTFHHHQSNVRVRSNVLLHRRTQRNISQHVAIHHNKRIFTKQVLRSSHRAGGSEDFGFPGVFDLQSAKFRSSRFLYRIRMRMQIDDHIIYAVCGKILQRKMNEGNVQQSQSRFCAEESERPESGAQTGGE